MTHYRKDKIKRVLLKVINITSYILSLLFIIFAIYGCATSSKEGSQSQKANIHRRLNAKEEEWNGINNYIIRDNNNYYFYYSFLLSNDFIDLLFRLNENRGFSLNNTSDFNLSLNGSSFGSCYYVTSYTQTSVQISNIRSLKIRYNSTLGRYYDYILNSNYNGSNTYPYTSLNVGFDINYNVRSTSFTYQTTSNGSMQTNGQLNYILLNYFNSTEKTIIDNYIDSLQPVESGGSGSELPIIEDTTHIQLNDDFNPLSLLNSNLYNNGLIYPSSTGSTLELTGLTFESNGQTFNKIIIESRTLNGINFSFDDGQTILDTSNYSEYLNYCYFYSMSYTFDDNNSSTSDLIVYPMQASFNNNGQSIYLNLSRYKWINDEYRSLTIIEDSETIIKDGMTTRELLSLRGSVSSAVIGLTSPFSFLTSGFNALGGILNIAILPGITLGLLLFIPLIVLIIITIFKMVKK